MKLIIMKKTSQYKKMRIGKVYKIIGLGDECYVGSTFNILEYRFSSHKCKYDRFLKTKSNRDSMTSFKLFDKYGIEKCRIELIKEYVVCNENHLKIYETLWMKKLKSINKFDSAGYLITKSSNLYKLYKSLYDKKIYSEKSTIKKQQVKLYRQKNRAEISRREKEKVLCVICNSYVARSHLSTHKKSKKCLSHNK